MQWIGYEFPYPVFVGSVHISTEEDKPDRLPALMYVEASCEKYFRTFVTSWVIFNPDHSVNKRYSGECGSSLENEEKKSTTTTTTATTENVNASGRSLAQYFCLI